jgi:hypothetical protein
MKNVVRCIVYVMAVIYFYLLTGCATQKTVDMASSYNAAHNSHVTAEAKKVATKSKAIQEMLTFDCKENTEACGAVKAMAAMVAAERIAGIEAAPFTLERHATDIDAQQDAIKAVSKGIPLLTMGVVAVKAIDDDKGVVNNNASEGSTVNNTYDEDHTTNFGDESSVSSQPNQDNSSEVIEAVEE